MKIGIVTHPFGINYGGILQAYALQTILEKQGHTVYFVRRNKEKCIKIKKIGKELIGLLRFFIINNYLIERIIYDKKIRSFVNSKFHNYYYIDDESNIKLDVLVAGSDQIWRRWSEKWDLMFYFLDFATKWKVKRYSYAASFGLSDWKFDQNETKAIKYYLSLFNKVTVREVDAIKLLKDTLDIDSELVLDPTFLLKKEDYLDSLNIEANLCHMFVSYILDKDSLKNDIVQSLSQFLNEDAFEVGSPQKCKNYTMLPGVEDWIANMSGAKYVVTDSFHGTVFSIIFNKNFVVLSNEFRGQSRLNSLLSLVGLQNRMVSTKEEALKIIQTPINWSRINTIVSNKRTNSLEFLFNM